jgi:hypothetical protein
MANRLLAAEGDLICVCVWGGGLLFNYAGGHAVA